MVVAIIVLAWLGLCFGSFTNALVWRLHEQGKKTKSKRNLSIVSGRSICPHCHHTLAWNDLLPVFSWIALGGRCRYCKKPISLQYPAVELAGAIVFALSYVLWPHGVHHGGDWVLFITWLAAFTGLLALLVYDTRYMLLPNKIIYPTFFVAAAGRLVYIIGFSHHRGHALLMWLASVAVASGIFWLLFVISSGKWIGFGDVRLGLITGTVLATPAKSFLMIFAGSILGTLFVLPAVASRKKTLTSQLPYGPFLIAACVLTLWFGSDVINWYKNLATF